MKANRPNSKIIVQCAYNNIYKKNYKTFAIYNDNQKTK